MGGERVLVAMSGGVDSSVVAAMLHAAGAEVIGVSMRLYASPATPGKSCCSPDDLLDARAVADACGFPFYVSNLQAEFEERVVSYFVEEYGRGRTPSPCVACNDHLKFDVLLRRLEAVDADALATGHYARIEPRPDGTLALLRGADPAKDQSYFLFGLRREVLPRVRFPLGGMRKADVRALAAELGVPTAAKPESQDICFVGKGSYADLVASRLGPDKVRPGVVRRVETGEVLGPHDGVHRFTPGQRRGLGVADGEPLYVRRVDATTGDVWVAARERAGSEVFTVERVNWLADAEPPREFSASVQVRYRQAALDAEVERTGDGALRVRLARPELGVAPGQAAVFYRGDEVLGGGWIEEVR